MTTTALEYKEVLSATGCAVLVFINPSGPVHTVFTVTGTSTDGLSCTVQVKMTELPADMADGLLVMLTVGAGTGKEKIIVSLYLVVNHSLCTVTISVSVSTSPPSAALHV